MLALNPSFARGWYLSGIIRVFAGQPDLAIEHVETSLRLSPRERTGTPLSVIGMAHFSSISSTKPCQSFSCRFRTIPAIPSRIAISPRAMPIWGRLDEARAIVAPAAHHHPAGRVK